MLVTLLRGTARRSALRTLSTAPQFDEAMAKAYNIVAENHRHKDGPWSRMRDKVIEAVDGRAGCTILDLASGPGEPAATVAEALPDAHVLATDVADAMVAAATNATSHLSNVKVQLADAQNLEGMSDASRWTQTSFFVTLSCLSRSGAWSPRIEEAVGASQASITASKARAVWAPSDSTTHLLLRSLCTARTLDDNRYASRPTFSTNFVT